MSNLASPPAKPGVTYGVKTLSPKGGKFENKIAQIACHFLHLAKGFHFKDIKTKSEDGNHLSNTNRNRARFAKLAPCGLQDEVLKKKS